MASGTSTIFLSSDPDELCHTLKFLLQQKRAGNNSDIITMKKLLYLINY